MNMRDEKPMMRILSGCEKHRMRVAAKFLRQHGYKFNGTENFYDAVFSVLELLDPVTRSQIDEVTDWVKDYENEEMAIYGTISSRSHAKRKSKTVKQKESCESGKAPHGAWEKP